MKVFVTKYALTTGIYAVDADEINDSGYAIVRSSGLTDLFAMGRDAFESEALALADQLKRVDSKLASLEKQSKKLLELKKTLTKC